MNDDFYRQCPCKQCLIFPICYAKSCNEGRIECRLLWNYMEFNNPYGNNEKNKIKKKRIETISSIFKKEINVLSNIFLKGHIHLVIWFQVSEIHSFQR